MGHTLIDKKKVRYQFGRAASTYDNASVVQRWMARWILQAVGDLSGMDVADLGCGTGYMLSEIEQHARQPGPASLVGVDISTRMLSVASERLTGTRLIAADMECLPVADGSFDCILSNAALQWCNTVGATGEMYRLLRDGGRLLATTFGPSTLLEWKTTDLAQLVATTDLATTRTIEAALTDNAFRQIEIKSELITLEYKSVDGMFSAIRDLGATFASRDRNRGLMGKSHYTRIRSLFERRLEDLGALPLTFEPLLITAVA